MARAKGAAEPLEMEQSPGATVEIPTTGPAVAVIDPPELERASVVGPEWAAEMRFMEEPVTVMVHESTEQYAEDPVRVFNNGVGQAFRRGEQVTVKRKYVYALAKARPISYSQDVHINQCNGEVVQRMQPRRALKYPFSVIHDANPDGGAWLKKVLQED